MNIRAIIIDFDGTIVTDDFGDVLSGLVGKQADSRRLNQLFHEGKIGGLVGLVQRINFLSGVSLDQIKQTVLQNYHLRSGAVELFEYARAKNIKTIIASGGIIPLLEIFQEKLGADYLVGSHPHIENGLITSISEADYSGLDFKIRDSVVILEKLGIALSEVVAIGDSPADRGIFDAAATSIAVHPKGGIEEFADFTVDSDLAEIIPILESLEEGR